MTRKNDRKLRQDKGETTEKLLATGYSRVGDAQMRNGTNTKYECSNCHLWFDEVTDVYIDTQLCWRCRRKYSTGG